MQLCEMIQTISMMMDLIIIQIILLLLLLSIDYINSSCESVSQNTDTDDETYE